MHKGGKNGRLKKKITPYKREEASLSPDLGTVRQADTELLVNSTSQQRKQERMSSEMDL